MKRFISSGLTLLAMMVSVMASPTNFINNGTIISPPAPLPTIDATNVANFGLIQLTVGTGLIGFPSVFPFSFSDVQTYTNRGAMICDVGFEFDNQPSGTGTIQRSSLFGNANNATITGGVTANMIVSATNLINFGKLEVGGLGFMSVDAEKLNLTHGTLNINPTNSGGLLNLLPGVFIDFWEIGHQTNRFSQGNYSLPNPISPPFNYTNNFYQFFQNAQITPFNAVGSINTDNVNPSNRVFEIVLAGNTNPAISVDVRYINAGGPYPIPVVQYAAPATNASGATSNYFYIADQFGAITNFSLITNYIVTGIPELSPTNYSASTTFPGFSLLPEGNQLYDPTILNGVKGLTNQYSAWGLTLAASTSLGPNPQPGQYFGNAPGRCYVNADKYLDMTSAKILGANYLSVNAPTHFVGSAGAQIAAPYEDITVASTNGSLSISNLVAPYLNDMIGTVWIYSARWTNVNAAGITNNFHVMMIDARLDTKALPLVENFSAISTNVYVGDILNVNSNLFINATSFTISSNAPGSPNGYGALNLLSPDIIWSNQLPALQYFTNFGLLSDPTTVYFVPSSESPYYTTNFTGSYRSVVNHGSIVTSGNTTWADYFENTGAGMIIANPLGTSPASSSNNALLYTSSGPITILASTAILTNDSVIAVAPSFGGNADVSIFASNLTLMQHVFNVSGKLTLTASNRLTDGGFGTSNFWSVTDGFDLLFPTKPVGDLLGTTVSNFSAIGGVVDNTWAGRDRGGNPSGFITNGALGQMTFDAQGPDSVFNYHAPDGLTNYAMYVGLIQLQDYATNRINNGGAQTFTAFNFDSNVKIYFADAKVGSNDISSKLDGANGGHFVWLPFFNGIFSTNNTIGSFVSTLSATTKGAFPKVAGKATPQISWFAPRLTTSTLQYATNLLNPNWLNVTNFVETNDLDTNVTFIDTGRTNRPVYYRVKFGP